MLHRKDAMATDPPRNVSERGTSTAKMDAEKGRRPLEKEALNQQIEKNMVSVFGPKTRCLHMGRALGSSRDACFTLFLHVLENGAGVLLLTSPNIKFSGSSPELYTLPFFRQAPFRGKDWSPTSMSTHLALEAVLTMGGCGKEDFHGLLPLPFGKGPLPPHPCTLPDLITERTPAWPSSTPKVIRDEGPIMDNRGRAYGYYNLVYEVKGAREFFCRACLRVWDGRVWRRLLTWQGHHAVQVEHPGTWEAIQASIAESSFTPAPVSGAEEAKWDGSDEE